MFQKKDFMVSESFGVCQVEDITKLSVGRGIPDTYYVLRSVYDRKKVSYIPVENHKVMLRDLMSEQEAKNALDEHVEKGEIDDHLCGEIAYVLKMEKNEIVKMCKKTELDETEQELKEQEK